ncbi:MAG: enoyl-CoA hydratase-related protein [Desulfobacterales bacterium]|nr:enoyl-CoA hydratase-related protein [Desulfobacterales bacterium]MDJ0988643.1 enoyl-CoA hydratase-related protein [Desulfobacterales bacterium]
MSFENIIYDREDGIAVITFTRPQALNALNAALLEEFDAALDRVENDSAIRVLVLTGAGEKAFVAGADITEINQLGPLGAKRFARRGADGIARLTRLPVPVIAAVNGFALGGGTEMALACDFIYAARSARFGLPEINLGIIPGFGGTQRLPRLIGPARARELIYTGRMVEAEEALRLGIVNRVCEDGELMDAVNETARLIATKGRVALRAAKQAVNTGLNVDLESGLALENDAFALCLASPDAKEGTRAFLEKRPAVFNAPLDD